MILWCICHGPGTCVRAYVRACIRVCAYSRMVGHSQFHSLWCLLYFYEVEKKKPWRLYSAVGIPSSSLGKNAHTIVFSSVYSEEMSPLKGCSQAPIPLSLLCSEVKIKIHWTSRAKPVSHLDLKCKWAKVFETFIFLFFRDRISLCHPCRNTMVWP